VLERGFKLAIVAPNGAGKTTLIRLMQGLLQPENGTIEWGQGVKKAFFDQDQVASLALDKTVFENACAAASNQTTQAVRTLLGNFLFKGNDVQKKASVLSGGERNRLGMVRVLLHQANTLILDEPTNHLDIPSKDILCQALQRFEGTILFVSHDQDFINTVATHILELQPDRAILFTGNYDDYLSCKSPVPEDEQSLGGIKTKSNTGKASQNSIKNDKDQSRDIKVHEQKISRLEKEIEQLCEQFGELEYGTPSFDAACVALKKLEKERDSIVSVWEKLIC
jgi:ATP-binding cassette subfamily F protein 3